jgi:hypothetical protein
VILLAGIFGKGDLATTDPGVRSSPEPGDSLKKSISHSLFSERERMRKSRRGRSNKERRQGK